jgi:hypothetical protein
MLTRIALALALATGVAACGDDDDSGGDEDAQVDASSDDTGSDDSGDDSSDSGDGNDIPFGTPEGCVEFGQQFAEASAAVSAAFSGETAEFGELASFFDEAADDIGGEVGEALSVLGDAYRQYGEAIEESGVDFSDPTSFQDPEVIAALTEASAAFEDPEVQEASQTLETFAANNCET